MKKYSRLAVSAGAFLITFLVYLITAAPDVQFTDSGELAGVCTTLGIAHPTGYPLFSVLGYFWSLIPNPATNIFWLNIFAAFLTAASSAVFANLVIDLYSFRDFISKSKSRQKNIPAEKKNIIALIIALGYGFAGLVWAQGVALEVYSLQLLMITLILWSFVNGIFKNSMRYLMLAALFTGLGFANHMTTVLLIPALFFLFFRGPGESFDFSKIRFRQLLWLLIPFVIGLSFYIYLPLRSATLPEFNWGWVHRGLDKFLYHVEGKQYQVWMGYDSKVMSENLGKFFSALPSQLAWIGLIPLMAGMIAAFIRSKAIFWFLLLMIITCLAYVSAYSIHDIQSYFITAIVGIFLFIAIGGIYLGKFNKNLPYLLILIPALNLYMNYDENDLSEDYLVPEYTRITAGNLEEDAVIISAQWDFWCSAFWYKQAVEGFRPDVTLIEKELLRRTWYPLQLQRWYPEETETCKPQIENYLRELEKFESGGNYNSMILQQNYISLLNCFIESHIDERPVYMTMDVMQTEPGFAKNYVKIPQGFAFRLFRRDTTLRVDIDNMKLEKFIESAKHRDDYLAEGIAKAAAVSLSNLGRYALVKGQTEQALKAFEKTLELNPDDAAAIQGLNSLRRR